MLSWVRVFKNSLPKCNYRFGGNFLGVKLNSFVIISCRKIKPRKYKISCR
ncbi:hypothetical protein Lalb_Chr23g0277451 [Lupinus albus]|uniref:Uncharacterized protein n=1 Tax=Lupinus albus TaxID=3870 RepID=A0A6A4NM74_LUPAL|nr:hypothetical protein Lalb_Chr23g0277451 [Lupinus albus]